VTGVFSLKNLLRVVSSKDFRNPGKQANHQLSILFYYFKEHNKLLRYVVALHASNSSSSSLNSFSIYLFCAVVHLAHFCHSSVQPSHLQTEES